MPTYQGQPRVLQGPVVLVQTKRHVAIERAIWQNVKEYAEFRGATAVRETRPVQTLLSALALISTKTFYLTACARRTAKADSP